jgi:solute carrier family 25 carnitine/acylcarnitine transporter 20/29
MAMPELPTAAATSTASTPTRCWSPVTRELVAGMLAGGVNVTSGFPFDTVKVRLQQAGGTSSMGQVACELWRTEGVSERLSGGCGTPHCLPHLHGA